MGWFLGMALIALIIAIINSIWKAMVYAGEKATETELMKGVHFLIMIFYQLWDTVFT